MADRFHLIGKRLSPAIGDYVPNSMDANWAFFDVVFFNHAAQPRATSCGYGAALPSRGR